MGLLPKRERCGTCAAEIFWLVNVNTRKAAPIDADPVPNGNISCNLISGGYEVISNKRKAEWAAEGIKPGPLHLNHWATCKAPPKQKGSQYHP